MKTAILGMRLKPHFIPMEKSPLTYRCVTAIRTSDEKFWGFVYRDEKDKNLWTNDRADGRTYKSRIEAGRDLIERIAR